jgi:hypothetical protein
MVVTVTSVLAGPAGVSGARGPQGAPGAPGVPGTPGVLIQPDVVLPYALPARTFGTSVVDGNDSSPFVAWFDVAPPTGATLTFTPPQYMRLMVTLTFSGLHDQIALYVDSLFSPADGSFATPVIYSSTRPFIVPPLVASSATGTSRSITFMEVINTAGTTFAVGSVVFLNIRMRAYGDASVSVTNAILSYTMEPLTACVIASV